MRNRAYPKGSIAEGYIAEECLTFCSLYMSKCETKFNRKERNPDGEVQSNGLSVFSHNVKPLGSYEYDVADKKDLQSAHWYILHNCEEVQPFFE